MGASSLICHRSYIYIYIYLSLSLSLSLSLPLSLSFSLARFKPLMLELLCFAVLCNWRSQNVDARACFQNQKT